ncbi:MAG: response regulator [Lachnospiraceae bacterium]|nr:response regulator [Lachnospiraceae bacterium]
MERTLNILLVEDDTETCARFAEYADMSPNISIVGVTNNSFRASELVSEMHPDAIILDLELNQGQGSGLQFLQDLKAADIPFKPYILVTTNNTSNTTYDYARQYGADFIMSKHKNDYSERNAIDFLEMMKEIIQNNISRQHSSYETTESPAQYEKRLKKRISMEIDKVGISPKANGYRYLIDAIYLVINGTTSNVCVEIGQKHSKTTASVERAIQNAINRAWKAEDIEVLLSNYTAKIRSEKGVPTLTEFVFFYANKIKNGY